MLFFISADIQTVVDDANAEGKEIIKKVDIEKDLVQNAAGSLKKDISLRTLNEKG